MHDPRVEAGRWWAQALDDCRFVRYLAQQQRFFDKACFVAQQAGEKALKACLYADGCREVFGHALTQFAHDLSQMDPEFKTVAGEAARLDRYYIPARYPNGLPGGTPFETYSASDLSAAVEDLNAVLAIVESFLATRGVQHTPS
jgi:HEPN domain-containing protein